MALVEVVLCSGFPTQVAIGGALGALGLHPLDRRRPAVGDVGVCRLAARHRCRRGPGVLVPATARRTAPPGAPGPARRRPRRSPRVASGGCVAFALVVVVMSLVQRLAPWLHNVTRNPMQDMIRSAADAWVFAVVGVVGGGLREEIQRAFVLRRFEQYLGGAWVGLVLFSLAFGAGHVIQGWDVTIATAQLWAFCGASCTSVAGALPRQLSATRVLTRLRFSDTLSSVSRRDPVPEPGRPSDPAGAGGPGEPPGVDQRTDGGGCRTCRAALRVLTGGWSPPSSCSSSSRCRR